MESSKPKFKLTAIAAGVTLLITGIGLVVYWQFNRRSWCVRTVSISSHEVTYSWGCVHPQRFRQWSITASASHQLPLPRPVDVDRIQTVDGDV